MSMLLYNGVPIKHSIDVFIKSNSAETGPPLGTILGNLGVNSSNFCKEFNNFTKSLPNYFVLKVRILVFENRSFSFFIKAPSTSFILSCLKLEKSLKVKVSHKLFLKSIFCINLNDLLKLSKFKFVNLTVERSLRMIWGTVISCSFIVILV